jgi:hypothetical protein
MTQNISEYQVWLCKECSDDRPCYCITDIEPEHCVWYPDQDLGDWVQIEKPDSVHWTPKGSGSDK